MKDKWTYAGYDIVLHEESGYVIYKGGEVVGSQPSLSFAHIFIDQYRMRNKSEYMFDVWNITNAGPSAGHPTRVNGYLVGFRTKLEAEAWMEKHCINPQREFPLHQRMVYEVRERLPEMVKLKPSIDDLFGLVQQYIVADDWELSKEDFLRSLVDRISSDLSALERTKVETG